MSPVARFIWACAACLIWGAVAVITEGNLRKVAIGAFLFLFLINIPNFLWILKR
jgi:hypothetical protein